MAQYFLVKICYDYRKLNQLKFFLIDFNHERDLIKYKSANFADFLC